MPTDSARYASHPPTFPGAPVDPGRWDAIDDEISHAPWLYDPEGNAIRVPAQCIGFQVRYWPQNARGIGELVLDGETGLPLFLPRNAGLEDLREAVSYRVGRYRLFLLDEERQRMAHAPAQVTITQQAADRYADRTRGPDAARSTATVVSAAPSVSSDLMAQAFMRLLDILDRGQGQALGSVTELLRAAGESGVVKKTAAIAAANAGAPVIVQAPAPEIVMPAAVTSERELPRNAVPGTAPAPTTKKGSPAAADSDADGDAAAEQENPLGIAAKMAQPLMEPLGAVFAAKAAQWLNVSPEEVERFAGKTAKAAEGAAEAFAQARDSNAAEDERHAAGAAEGDRPIALQGDALDAHVRAIQSALSNDDKVALFAIGARHMHRFDELKRIVGTMALERALVVIRKLVEVWNGLTVDEQAFLGGLIEDPRTGFKSVLGMVEERTVPNAIKIIRATKLEVDKRRAA
jgi:hypothetical protein